MKWLWTTPWHRRWVFLVSLGTAGAFVQEYPKSDPVYVGVTSVGIFLALWVAAPVVGFLFKLPVRAVGALRRRSSPGSPYSLY